jgi:GntR family transcriptional regulator
MNIPKRREKMLDLDIRSRKPIYEQLVEKLKELIIHEVLKADEQLPSVRALAKELTINPNTIQKAYRELEHQGYIYSVPGKGSFVAPQAITMNNEKVEKMKNDLIKLISEALYLGMKKEDILSLIEIAEQSVKGGTSDDQNH